MSTNRIDLEYSIVAFVDILGFSNMVESDCENRTSAFKYFEVLRELNKETREIGECDITQFSDSVIFSLPLAEENYLKMINLLSEYQKKLLYHSILCRGAIAYGKHYNENDFIFSQALIEAYQLEAKDAIYPRIILSENLFEYFAFQKPELLLIEKDGRYFVDYLKNADREKSYQCLTDLNHSLSGKSLAVKEKYYWLFKYWEYKFEEILPFSIPQFSSI